MTVPICPQCKQVIPADEINVAKDLAYCRRCNVGHELSELVQPSGAAQVDLQRPPSGTWFANDMIGSVAGASHRSWGKALGMLGVSLFWNGIVSVFVAVAISGTLNQMGIVAPEWFPAPKMNDETMGLGMVLFLWLFLMPFIVIGAGMILTFLSILGGKTEVRVGQGLGTVYVGIGRLGWTRRFDSSQVKAVEITQRTSRNTDGGNQTEIWLEQKNGKVIKFGSLLNEERQHFLAAAVRQMAR